MMTNVLSNNLTIVVKVGSSLVTHGGHGVNTEVLTNWATQIATLRQRGIRVILVSSGAIAEGMKRLGWVKRPKALHELQAAAAVGQMGLAQAYESAFKPFHIQTAQILLTHDDVSHRTRYLNARSTLNTLLDNDVVPIVNENDTVTIDEIKLGDNDTLGALVANLLDAEMLIILTDQQGLYNQDPRIVKDAQLIHRISVTHPDLENMAGGAGSAIGTGGMYTKVMAAKRASSSGTITYVASGNEPNILIRLLDGETIGTCFEPDTSKLRSKQQWLTNQLRLSGSLTIDVGAEQALYQRHASLLPVGCLACSGNFVRGSLVAIHNIQGKEIARGLVNYNHREVEKILQLPSDQIESVLGYLAEEELVHRDNLVLIKP